MSKTYQDYLCKSKGWLLLLFPTLLHKSNSTQSEHRGRISSLQISNTSRPPKVCTLSVILQILLWSLLTTLSRCLQELLQTRDECCHTSSSEICLWSKQRLRRTDSLNMFHYIKAYLTAAPLLRVSYVFPVTCHLTISSGMGSSAEY